MASRKRYQLDRVTVEPGDSRPATWTFAGEAVSGTELSYAVVDGNSPGRNAWEFMVRVPKARGGRLEVRPRTDPEPQGVGGPHRPVADLRACHQGRGARTLVLPGGPGRSRRANGPRTW